MTKNRDMEQGGVTPGEGGADAVQQTVRQNIARLGQLFPEVVTDGKVDLNNLKQTLGLDVEEDKGTERYCFTWRGKSRARRLAQEPASCTLMPMPGESVNWEDTENLFYEGDNLEALKLLQRSHHGKIKMIYIDPPYNTGKDFLYLDKYRDSLSDYLRITGKRGHTGDRPPDSETSGRIHTNWLNMIFPRLMLARDLLHPEGLIFISIDHTEAANLRKVCDEIFAEEHFLAAIVWEKRFTRSNNAKLFATLTESILCYRKSPALEMLREPRDAKANSIYRNPDQDPRGPWTSVSYINPATRAQRPNLVYPITNPATGEEVNHPTNAWKYEQRVHQRHVREDRLWWGKGGRAKYPRLKKFLSEVEGGMVPVDLWGRKQTGTTDEGSKELLDLLGAKVFDFPKPHTLIKRAVAMATGDGDIVLDFFAGTCPAAHAVIQQNLEDGGRRRFIMVQWAEPCHEKSQAFQSGFKTIADIGKERIRRVLQEAARRSGVGGDKAGEGPGLDLGFRVYKLKPS